MEFEDDCIDLMVEMLCGNFDLVYTQLNLKYFVFMFRDVVRLLFVDLPRFNGKT